MKRMPTLFGLQLMLIQMLSYQKGHQDTEDGCAVKQPDN